MITIYKTETAKVTKGKYFTTEDKGLEFRGLSTDDPKPTEVNGKPVDNGATFIEMDTGKIYLYDQENEQWKEI